MYAIINDTTYVKLSNLQFGGQIDPTCNTLPVDELTVEIVTGDAIAYGQFLELYDDLDGLWAKYWIVASDNINDKLVRVRAQSMLGLLDRIELPAVLYSAEPIDDVLDTIFHTLAAGGATIGIDYELDSGYDGETVSGFCPAQNARERLQLVCFTLGAIVQTAFTDTVLIRPIEDEEKWIPLGETYRTPELTNRDYVTGVKLTAFAYTQGTPTATDEWVSDGTETYIVSRQVVELTNSAAPAAALVNVITVDNVGIVNSGNVSGILSRLATYWFKRAEVTLDCIDNAAYGPGDKVLAYLTPEALITGYVQQATWAFGLQAKASMKIAAVDAVAGARLTVTAMWGDVRIGETTYYFPVGYMYGIDNLYIEMMYNDHRYIFRPTTESVEGTMPSEGATATVEYEVALDLYEGVLHTLSVDGITAVTDETTGIVTGVIS